MKEGSLDVVMVSYKSPEDVAAVERDLPGMTRMPYRLHYFDNSANVKTLSALWNDLGRQGEGEFVAFLNTDIRLSPGWDERLVLGLWTPPEFGVAIPRPIGHDWPTLADPKAAPYPDPWTAAAPPPNVMAMMADKYEKDPGFYVFRECTASFYTVLMRRCLWEEMKGFDERLRFYGQDHDFQRRLAKRKKLWAVRVNRCPVWHRCAGSVKKAIGDVDFDAEMNHCGNYGVQIINQAIKEWDLLGEGERLSVREDPRFRSMPRVVPKYEPAKFIAVSPKEEPVKPAVVYPSKPQ